MTFMIILHYNGIDKGPFRTGIATREEAEKEKDHLTETRPMYPGKVDASGYTFSVEEEKEKKPEPNHGKSVLEWKRGF